MEYERKNVAKVFRKLGKNFAKTYKLEKSVWKKIKKLENLQKKCRVTKNTENNFLNKFSTNFGRNFS